MREITARICLKSPPNIIAFLPNSSLLPRVTYKVSSTASIANLEAIKAM
jgi:hypothetical protein